MKTSSAFCLAALLMGTGVGASAQYQAGNSITVNYKLLTSFGPEAFGGLLAPAGGYMTPPAFPTLAAESLAQPQPEPAPQPAVAYTEPAPEQPAVVASLPPPGGGYVTGAVVSNGERGAAIGGETEMGVAANVSPEIQNGVTVALEAIRASRGSAVAMLDNGQPAAEIQGSRYGSQAVLSSYVGARISAGDRAIDAMQTNSGTFAGAARSDFDAATRDVQANRQQLADALAAATSATPDTWEQAKANLASAYTNYVQAVGRAEAVTHGSSAGSGNVPAPLSL